MVINASMAKVSWHLHSNGAKGKAVGKETGSPEVLALAFNAFNPCTGRQKASSGKSKTK